MTTSVTHCSATPHRPDPQTTPLPADPRAPSQARRAASAYLHRTQPSLAPDQHADVLLIVSELVTNAVRYTPGPCALTLTTTAHGLDVAVTDTSCTEPAPRTPDLAGGTGGLGLHIVDDLGARVFTEPVPGGKCVHAAFEDV
ncbi:ATP-binding protein [Streptomyces sp. SID7909]|uniref:ATP-binding protein n=1 Tax=Streptomyces sp. SID7909 TaxID=2706092 RepID=UPI0013BCA7D6|nr:ATP-binding protein [Streptomyces sp. SID7909]NEC07319.1 ATP-binding protein [Streptomyces sp. SID7909]